METEVGSHHIILSNEQILVEKCWLLCSWTREMYHHCAGQVVTRGWLVSGLLSIISSRSGVRRAAAATNPATSRVIITAPGHSWCCTVKVDPTAETDRLIKLQYLQTWQTFTRFNSFIHVSPPHVAVMTQMMQYTCPDIRGVN